MPMRYCQLQNPLHATRHIFHSLAAQSEEEQEREELMDAAFFAELQFPSFDKSDEEAKEENYEEAMLDDGTRV